MALALPPPNRAEQAEWAWKKRLAGWTQERIADELGLNQSTVSRMLARFERRALVNLRRRVRETKARQTLQLEHIQDEAMRAWERSKQIIHKAKRKETLDRWGNVHDLEEESVEESTGDPRYLEVARKAVEDVRKLWGIDEATGEDELAPAGPASAGPEARDAELARLDRMSAALVAKAARGDVEAIGAMVRIATLRAKLLGLDEAPGAAGDDEEKADPAAAKAARAAARAAASGGGGG